MIRDSFVSGWVLTAGAVAISTAVSAFAEPEDSRPAAPAGPPRLEASVTSSYTAPGDAKMGGVKLGDSDAFDLNLSFRGMEPINDRWSWTWGGRSQNLSLGAINGAPIPGCINTLHLNGGVGYRFDGRWMVNGFVGPTLYRFDDVDADTFGVSGGVIASCRSSDTLTWIVGLIVTPDSDVPVLPFGGVRWRIDEQWRLEVGMPQTRLSYHPDSKWVFFTGLDMVGTTFRTGRNFGNDIGSPLYNNALATYRDIRLGVGCGYELIKGLRLEVETGGSVYRRIDYRRIDQEVDFDPRPTSALP